MSFFLSVKKENDRVPRETIGAPTKIMEIYVNY